MLQLRALIERAVRDAVAKADGPVGICLSGGIDSSTVAAFAPELPSFTGWYEGEQYDERRWARLARTREHHEVQITPQDFFDVFEDVRATLGDLRCGPGAVGQYVVARYAASKGIKTLLTGEGGDELFGGYARILKVASRPLPDGYGDDFSLPTDYPTRLRGALQYEWDALGELCAVDEKIAGAHGIKVVPPLLNPWVVAHVHAEARNYIYRRVGKKWIRREMRGVVPDAILDRTDKRGFPVPFVQWANEIPEVRMFVERRIGYVPDASKPWDRQWWYDMLAAKRLLPVRKFLIPSRRSVDQPGCNCAGCCAERAA